MIFSRRVRIIGGWGGYIAALMFGVAPVLAKKTIGDAEGSLKKVVGKTGIKATNVSSYVGDVIQLLLLGVGLAFFVLMFYAGFTWFTSRGEEEKVTKARKMIIAAVIGLVIVSAAYAITIFVTKGFIGGNTSSP